MSSEINSQDDDTSGIALKLTNIKNKLLSRDSEDGDDDDDNDDGILDPPDSCSEKLKYLGPGFVSAATVVGSGELVATTLVGAVAGMDLLWFIVLGCMIKVFMQIEFGRNAIITSKTTLDAMNEIPGPRIKKTNIWLWLWILNFISLITGFGGIIGGVGQSLAIGIPMTNDLNNRLDFQIWNDALFEDFSTTELAMITNSNLTNIEKNSKVKGLKKEYKTNVMNYNKSYLIEKLTIVMPELKTQKLNPVAINALLANKDPVSGRTQDDLIWGGLITFITSILITCGKFHVIEIFSIVMVGSFTLLCIINVFALQSTDEFSLSGSDIGRGFSFSLPDKTNDTNPIVIAFSTFGIIGMGATDVATYPYWCIEKGYAKYTGKKETPVSETWLQRARGWINIMHWDAFGAMFFYTFTTVAFYTLGASVLHPTGKIPKGDRMIKVLSSLFIPVFGTVGEGLYLFGSFVVLYSTFFLGFASFARLGADTARVFGCIKDEKKVLQKWVQYLSFILPWVSFITFASFKQPVGLILFLGIMQGFFLPVTTIVMMWFRYYRTIDELKPNKVWDAFLWISGIPIFISGFYAMISKLIELGE